jgi:hypothetical protein
VAAQPVAGSFLAFLSGNCYGGARRRVSAKTGILSSECSPRRIYFDSETIGYVKALKTPLHIFERLRVVCVDSTGPELRETQSVSGQALEFCPSEIFSFFTWGEIW